MTNEERKIQYMNRNVKLSPSLIALTWDVIFIWTISTLYFTTVKGLTNSQTVMLDSILMFSGALLCVPVAKIFQKVTPINATRIGLIGYAGYLLLCIFGNSYPIFICAQIFLSFGYVINAVKTNRVLTDSLSVVNRDKDYQRIYGKGLSLYYILECVGSIFITYAYSWKPTSAFWLSFIIVSFTFILTFLFKEPSKYMEKNVDLNLKDEIIATEKKPDSFGKILKSGFFITLLIYAFFFRGVLSVTGSSLKIYLNTLIDSNTIPLWSYGILYAISRLCASLSSKYQFKFNLKFGVRSLLIFNILIILTFVLTGLVFVLNLNSYLSMTLILLLCYIMCSLRMPNQIFLNNYLQVCTSKKNIERAYSIRTMVEYFGYAAISFVYSLLLTVFGDNYGLTNMSYIAIFAIPLVISLIFFIRALCKKYAQKYTIIKPEYTED